jgi:hypothetical protein
VRKQAEATNGKFSIELNLAELEIRADQVLGVVVEAPGYEISISEPSIVQEGDRHFEIKLTRGGNIQGIVQTPSGEVAGGASVAIAQSDWGAVFNERLGSFTGREKTIADTQGHFDVKKPVLATYCAISHDSGWALEKIPADGNLAVVKLQPWASVEIHFDRSAPRGSGSAISLSSFNRTSENPLDVSLSLPADSEQFEFPRVPAGNFVAALVPMTRWAMTYFYALQTNFTLAAGERRVIELKSEGAQVSAKVKLPNASISKDDMIAILTRDIPIARQRGAEYFATSESLNSGTRQFWTDPAAIAARSQERSYFAGVDENGRVTFPGVPAGRYVFECKQLEPAQQNSDHEPKIIAAARATVEIGASHAQDLGCFELEAK